MLTAATDRLPSPDADPTVTAGRRRRLREAGRRGALRLVSLIVLIGVWQAVVAAEVWPRVLVPSPGDVWRQFVLASTTHDGVRGYGGHLLIEHLGVSLGRIGTGAGYAVLVGVPLGLLIGVVRPLAVVLEPVVTFLRTLPPLAYLSLLVIWFGIDEAPKIWLLVIAALPPIAAATAAAVRTVPDQLVEAARALGSGPAHLLLSVRLPAALPEILTGIRIAVGVAYTSVVAAETINGTPGIGGMIRDAQRYNQTALVIAGILAIGLSGIVLDALLRGVERIGVPWRGRT
ncbi:ABC transporter permease [Streptomyces sp. WM4235]|uniref:ABC transporter permease n=1 Tax=unclassified Streptomyces TaxID=2593676 RepID=UPI0006C4AE8D|nr:MULTISPECIES: ABC transporter permease [unclassified Streptomyces]KOU42716.1 ABC transporter permease [Streptomyces sp. WM4235]MCX5076884.1 ABC transporter permease [Streptomyces sp. NBC_00424]WUD45760.1 ABC transporter permease [Streptomyces sp. NBC_00513]